MLLSQSVIKKFNNLQTLPISITSPPQDVDESRMTIKSEGVASLLPEPTVKNRQSPMPKVGAKSEL